MPKTQTAIVPALDDPNNALRCQIATKTMLISCLVRRTPSGPLCRTKGPSAWLDEIELIYGVSPESRPGLAFSVSRLVPKSTIQSREIGRWMDSPRRVWFRRITTAERQAIFSSSAFYSSSKYWSSAQLDAIRCNWNGP